MWIEQWEGSIVLPNTQTHPQCCIPHHTHILTHPPTYTPGQIYRGLTRGYTHTTARKANGWIYAHHGGKVTQHPAGRVYDHVYNGRCWIYPHHSTTEEQAWCPPSNHTHRRQGQGRSLCLRHPTNTSHQHVPPPQHSIHPTTQALPTERRHADTGSSSVCVEADPPTTTKPYVTYTLTAPAHKAYT